MKFVILAAWTVLLPFAPLRADEPQPRPGASPAPSAEGRPRALQWTPEEGYTDLERRPLVEERSPVALYNDLLTLFERESYADAARLSDALSRDTLFEQSPLLEPVLYYHAESLYMLDELRDALGVYEDLLRRYPDTIFISEVLERQFDIARRYLDGSYKWSLAGIPIGMRSSGRSLIDTLLQRAPYSRFAAEAHFLLAKSLYDQDDFTSAEIDFRVIPQFYPESPYAPLAMMYRARCLLAMHAGPAYSQAAARDAEVLFREYRREYPVGAPAREAQNNVIRSRNQRAETLLEVASYYRRRGRPQSAEMYYRQIVRQFSDTPPFETAVDKLHAMGLEVLP